MDGFEIRKKFNPKKAQVAKPPGESPVSITQDTAAVGGGALQGLSKKVDTTQRSNAWSITINNPSVNEERCDVPGWWIEGQHEVGEGGTRHYQGLLHTPQVRWSAVKAVYPRANIQPAKNVHALKHYVHKTETRVAAQQDSGVESLFQFQSTIAGDWKEEKFVEVMKMFPNKLDDEVALMYVDSLVSARIRAGQRGAEFIGINPMWRSSWKKFYRDIIARHGQVLHQPATPYSEIHSGAEGGDGARHEAPAKAWRQVDICEESVGDSSEKGGNEIC